MQYPARIIDPFNTVYSTISCFGTRNPANRSFMVMLMLALTLFPIAFFALPTPDKVNPPLGFLMICNVLSALLIPKSTLSPQRNRASDIADLDNVTNKLGTLALDFVVDDDNRQLF
jgi:hypothetical protein